MVTVRPTTVAVAPAMGQLVVRAWQAAYRGQIPDDHLNGLRAEERAASWDRVAGPVTELLQVDTVACQEITGGKRQSQRSRPSMKLLAAVDRGDAASIAGWFELGHGPLGQVVALA